MEMSPAEEGADERMPWLTDGAARRGVLAAGIGLLVLVGGLAVLAGVRTAVLDSPAPPWVGVASVACVSALALAGMFVSSRTMERGAGAGSSGGARRAGSAAGAGPAPVAMSERHPLDHLQVETRTGKRLLAVSDVEWIQADGNYVRIHLPHASFLYRMPLSRLEGRLEHARFLRVHRSAMINLDAVRRVEPLRSGDLDAEVASGAKVRISRRYARAFHERTGRSH